MTLGSSNGPCYIPNSIMNCVIKWLRCIKIENLQINLLYAYAKSKAQISCAAEQLISACFSTV